MFCVPCPMFYESFERQLVQVSGAQSFCPLLTSFVNGKQTCFKKGKKKLLRLIVTIQIALKLFNQILKMKLLTSTRLAQ